MKVKPSKELLNFLKTPPPEQRQFIRRKLHDVEHGRLSPENLEEPLERFYKISAGKFRILCAIESNAIYALFADRRATVYELASAALLEKVLQHVRES